jgi:tetratricopeptide (TPR) repeat protein
MAGSGAAAAAGGRMVNSNSATRAGATRLIDHEPTRARSSGRLWRFALVPVIASLIVVDAVTGGGSSPAAQSVAAILVWWTLLTTVAVSLAPRSLVPRSAVLSAALLGAFAALTALSMGWAPSPEGAFLEADRVLLYLGVLLLPVLLARTGDADRWADGIALAAVVVAALALGQRLFPGLLPDDELAKMLPNASNRLSYPVGYWNGLAIFAALGVPLLLRAAVVARTAAGRATSLAPIPLLAATIYLTSSRGGIAVAVLASGAFVVLCSRVRAVLAAVVGAAASLAAVAVLSARAPLVAGPFDSAAAETAGSEAAMLIGAICVSGGLFYAALASFVPSALAVPRLLWASAVAVIVAGLVAIAPGERFDSFKLPPPAQEAPGATQVGPHLVSGGGSGRWQFWDAAVDQWRERPVLGGGSGSFEPWWAQHGSLDWFVRNAHSLWLETLGELGLAGLLLLAGSFAVALTAGVARLRDREDAERATVAALLAVVVGFGVGASIDWVWQLPAVTAVAMLSLGLLVGPATIRRGYVQGQERAPRPGARVALALLAWISICAQALPFLAAQEVGSSQSAATRGDFAEALERARSAEAIQPWAASPRLQLALVREELGDLGSARADIAAAVERDGSDWRLQLVTARLATKAGDIDAARRALARARELNPRSPLLTRPVAPAPRR